MHCPFAYDSFFSLKFSLYNSLCLFIKLKFDTTIIDSLLLPTSITDNCDWSNSLSEFCWPRPLALLIYHAMGACQWLLDSRVLRKLQIHFMSGGRSFSGPLWEPGNGKWLGCEARSSRLPAPFGGSFYFFYILGFFIYIFSQYKEFNWFSRVWKWLVLYSEAHKGNQTWLGGQNLSLSVAGEKTCNISPLQY